MSLKMDANCKTCAAGVECDVIASPDSAAGTEHPEQKAMERIGKLQYCCCCVVLEYDIPVVQQQPGTNVNVCMI